MGREPRVEEKEPVIENRIEAPEAYKEEPRHPEAEKTTVVPANTDISHTVSKGESLWRIAAKASVYDNPVLWPKIWLANRNLVSNPDKILPGQQLSIPASGGLTKEEKRAAKKYHSEARQQERNKKLQDSDQKQGSPSTRKRR